MKKAIYFLAFAAVVAAGAILGGCNSSPKKTVDETMVVQQTVSELPSDSAKMVAKVDKNKVPKAVTDYYITDYPPNNDVTWYGYDKPDFDYTNSWYDNWYDYGPYAHSKSPDYYLAEFADSSTSNNKAVYSKTGKKIAVHKKISDLPSAISSAISTGIYKDWTMDKDKEEIFKDKESDQLKIYRVIVTKGKEKHALFFQPDGKMVKDKKVS